MPYQSAEEANQQAIATLTELEQRARDLVNVLKGGIDVGQTGTLGDLALIDTLALAPVGDAATLRGNMGLDTAATYPDSRYAKSAGGDFSAMPTVNGDPIVESGSNSDGEWARWAEGTQICAHVIETDVSGKSGGTGFSWAYPANFIEQATQLFQLSWNELANGDRGAVSYTQPGSNTLGPGVVFKSGSWVGASVITKAFAKGKWK